MCRVAHSSARKVFRVFQHSYPVCAGSSWANWQANRLGGQPTTSRQRLALKRGIEAHNPEVETKRFAHDTYRRIKERVRLTRSSRVPACKSQTPDSAHPDRWHLPPELAPVVAALLSFSAAADSTGSPEWSNCVWEERSEHYGRDAPPSPCASGTRERSMSSWNV
jgi:hypothetical protein